MTADKSQDDQVEQDCRRELMRSEKKLRMKKIALANEDRSVISLSLVALAYI